MNEIRNQKIEALEMVTEYMPRLILGAKQAAELLQEGKIDIGYNLVVDVIDGCTWLIEALHVTNDLHAAPLELDTLKGLLQMFLEALENNDTVLLGDVLEYELVEQLEIWQEISQGTLKGYSKE